MADVREEPSGWAVGWTYFAAVMMFIIGVFHAMAGLIAIVDDEFYVATRDYVLKFDVTQWGWIHLIVGILIVIAGGYLFKGSVLARTVGVIMAAISAIVGFGWMPYYPVYGVVMVAMAVCVIWALTAHGRDVTYRGTDQTVDIAMAERAAGLSARLERLLLWRAWERMLEIEFVDRSIALAGKAFVSFFPLVIVIAAFMPDTVRTSILTTLTNRLGFRGESLTLAQQAFASSDDVRDATSFMGLLLTVFFATSFTTALQRVYQRAWRRPAAPRAGAYAWGAIWLLATLVCMAVLGFLRGILDSGPATGLFVLVTIVATTGLWWFTPWFLLVGDVRARVLLPTGLVTSVALAIYAGSATVWMPEVLTSNEEQFGVFGVALALVTWFSGAAICILVGACLGPVLAEDVGWVGSFIRGDETGTLTPDARPPLPPPNRELTLRDAFQSTDDR